MNPKCTKRVYPPGLAGIGAAHNCGNPSKAPNAEGEPRCGIHSDAAYARRDAQRKAQEQAERERHARTIATHGGQVFLTPGERAVLLALVREDNARQPYESPDTTLADLIKKLS